MEDKSSAQQGAQNNDVKHSWYDQKLSTVRPVSVLAWYLEKDKHTSRKYEPMMPPQCNHPQESREGKGGSPESEV